MFGPSLHPLFVCDSFSSLLPQGFLSVPPLPLSPVACISHPCQGSLSCRFFWVVNEAQVRSEIIEQAWGGGVEEDIPPHFGAVSVSRILKTRMIGLVNAKIPWDKTGVGFPLLSVSDMHLTFPNHFFSFSVRQFFILPHRYEELWGLYSLGKRSDHYSPLSQTPEWQFFSLNSRSWQECI